MPRTPNYGKCVRCGRMRSHKFLSEKTKLNSGQMRSFQVRSIYRDTSERFTLLDEGTNYQEVRGSRSERRGNSGCQKASLFGSKTGQNRLDLRLVFDHRDTAQILDQTSWELCHCSSHQRVSTGVLCQQPRDYTNDTRPTIINLAEHI